MTHFRSGAAKLATAAVLVGALGLAGAAHADLQVIAGTGYAGIAGNGNSGVDAFGQSWTWGKTTGDGTIPKGRSIWGTPGFLDGIVDDYSGSLPATAFSIAFLTQATKTYIDTTPSIEPGGSNDETRFDVCTSTCVEWTPVYSPGADPLQVTFMAPAGDELVKGDSYFVNVAFTTGKLSGKNAGFSAVYLNDVPEPATWALMLVGVAGLGFTLRRRRSGAIA